MLYFHKKFFLTAFRFLLAFAILFCFCICEILSRRTESSVIGALSFGCLALAVALLAWVTYQSLYDRFARAYRISSQGEVEYQFISDRLLVSSNQKQYEMLWSTIRDVWISKHLIILSNQDQKHIPLPISSLNQEQKSFVRERLATVHPLSARELRCLESA